MADIVVIGAGVFGLSVALAAHRAGRSVEVLEAERPGAGASGGFVGALTPHAPTRWRPMMAFQFAALSALPDYIAQLERETGLATGYGRIGRAVPLGDDAALARAETDVAAARKVWGNAGRMEIRDRPDWFAPGLARCGVLYDDLSARVDPRAYLRALVAALPAGCIRKAEVRADAHGLLEDGRRIVASHIVCAGGARGWPLLPPPLQGQGVKGQAALFRVAAGDLPVVTHMGLYVVPHADGTVAVGSTSEKAWDGSGTDGKLDDLVARARAIVPALGDVGPIARWSGVRPKPPGREPLVGPVPGRPGVWIAGGGFKIGFGIAHAVGETLVAMIEGRDAPIPVPETFLPG